MTTYEEFIRDTDDIEKMKLEIEMLGNQTEVLWKIVRMAKEFINATTVRNKVNLESSIDFATRVICENNDVREKWIPPKEKRKYTKRTKKLKLYRPIYESPTSGKYVIGEEAGVSKELLIHPAKVAGWHEIEIQMDQ
jgi:hypothetical protein